jgi:hypothetical protein
LRKILYLGRWEGEGEGGERGRGGRRKEEGGRRRGGRSEGKGGRGGRERRGGEKEGKTREVNLRCLLVMQQDTGPEPKLLFIPTTTLF